MHLGHPVSVSCFFSCSTWRRWRCVNISTESTGGSDNENGALDNENGALDIQKGALDNENGALDNENGAVEWP